MLPRSMRPGIALAAAAFALQPTLANAQEPCITEAQISDMIVYGVPIALQAAQMRCAPQLAADGFMARDAVGLSAKYLARKEAAWPGAVAALSVFIGDDPDAQRLMAALPREALQPFVDAVVEQKVLEEIPLEDCDKIERGIEAVAPLEPEEAGKLIAVIMSLTDAKQPSVCPVEEL